MTEKSKIFESILCTIENNDIREFAEKCIDTIPDYFWEVGASSSGKYHPQYALGDGGLARHTCALVRILNYMLEIDCVGNEFTSREKDLLRIAGMMHDSRKSGSQEDWLENKHTRFNHPILAAHEIKNIDGIDDDERNIVLSAIASHMGQFNTDKKSDIILPLPRTKYQKIVHLADYLASRKDLEVLFSDEFTKPKVLPDIATYKLTFGKYTGKTLIEIQKENPGYITWAKNNIHSEPVSSLLKQI